MKSDFVGRGRERSRGRGRWICVAWHGFYFRSGGARRNALNAIGLRNDLCPARDSQIAWRPNFHLVQECDQ